MTTRALLAATMLAGCVGAPSGRDTPTAAGDQASLPWVVGESIRLTGTFAGWRGPCVGQPPVSRSDWMLTTERGCIYVHGPMPGGAASGPEAPDGRVISVEGTIRLDRSGRKYLSLQ